MCILALGLHSEPEVWIGYNNVNSLHYLSHNVMCLLTVWVDIEGLVCKHTGGVGMADSQ